MLSLRRASILLAILTTGLSAGFFYAYACSVTLGLARLDDAAYVVAMQEINATVRNPVFAFGFFGALVSLAAATLLHLRGPRSPRGLLVLAALVVYAAGGFGVTMRANVPLNRDLERVERTAAPETLARERAAYEDEWNAWNVVRTLGSTLAFALVAATPFVPESYRRRAEGRIAVRPGEAVGSRQ